MRKKVYMNIADFSVTKFLFKDSNKELITVNRNSIRHFIFDTLERACCSSDNHKASLVFTDCKKDEAGYALTFKKKAAVRKVKVVLSVGDDKYRLKDLIDITDKDLCGLFKDMLLDEDKVIGYCEKYGLFKEGKGDEV